MKPLNLDSFSSFGLQLRFTFERIGAMTCIAFLLCLLGAATWLWLMPKLHAQTERQLQESVRLQRSLKSNDGIALVAPPSATEQRMANYYDTLGEKRYAEQQIKTLFAIAGKTGLSLDQAEYKSAFDKNSNTSTFQIILPVKGPYVAIRQFCEKTLLSIPFASLDEMNFKRDTIANRTLEAKLRFTLYLTDTPNSDKKMAGL
ncbi:MAG: hypothetical protein ACXWJK_11630 [Burkholderiaceae bacterium]